MADKLSRRDFLKTTSAAVVAGIGGISVSEAQEQSTQTVREAVSAAKRRPNFVVFYTDDQGYGDLGCYGASDFKTPNLDALAASGVRFTSWYSNSPVCSPSRASLMTGCYPQRVGVPNILGGGRGTPGLSTEHTTIARALKDHGYATGIFGKWHLGVADEFRPNRHGFDEFFGFMAGCVDYYSHIYYWGQGGGTNPVHDLWENDAEVWQNGRYLTELITERAVDFIDRHSDEPFFLYVPYNAPHYPMHAPQKYLDRFPDLPWDRGIMAAMVAAVDDGVGEVVQALKAHGIYEDTVVFFSSDNGPSTETRNWLDGKEDIYYGGSAGIFRGHKASLFDGGVREPAILNWPGGIPGGQVCGEVGVTMDVFPTFLDIAGIEIDSKVDGSSVLPMVTQGAETPHERVFWAYRDQLAVRQANWKLVLNGMLDFSRKQPDAVHLSDMEADPGERTNLKDEHPDLVNELTAAVKAWDMEVNPK